MAFHYLGRAKAISKEARTHISAERMKATNAANIAASMFAPRIEAQLPAIEED